MNGTDKISIIVPIYNAERYIEKCIKSIINQNYSNLEVILIDDGSEDKSLLICKKFAAKDERIRVIHQNNGGVASARNRGISEANGRFVAWVDSDDSIEPDYIQQLYDKAQKYNADISIAQRKCKNKVIYLHNKEKIVQEYLMGNLTSYLWSTLVKKELYNNLGFERLKIGEDALMLCQLYCKAERLVIFPNDGYNYFERPDSASSNRSFSSLRMWLWGVKEQGKIVEINCPSCLAYMNYKKTLYALSFLTWTKELKDEGVTLFRKELWDMFHNSIHHLPVFHISLRQYKRLVDLYMEARTIQ